MAVQFILGRSGTGKTSRCIKSVISELTRGEDGPPLVLLVPEQATYQGQRAVLASKEISGYSRLRVLSFERLSFWLIGRHTAQPEISRLGREMIIHKILRANQDKLKLLHRTAQTPGVATKLTQIIAEMNECASSASDLRQLSLELAKAEPRSITAMKFADIARIFEQYEQFISGRFTDPDIQLSGALEKVRHADFLVGAKIWVDGFASFTVQQRLLLIEMLKVASESYIALCLDPQAFDTRYPDQAELDDTRIFGLTERTFAELTEAVRRAKLPLAKPIILEQPLRFAASPALAHIESSIFNPAAALVNTNDAVKIVSTANRRAEVRYIAAEITKLVAERNYRFGDIAVIASDISSYQHYIEAVFGDYNIPFFIDKPKSLSTHPVIRLITSATRAVTNGFSNSDIFIYLKTGLAPVTGNDVDILENYCLAFGIDGADWRAGADWAFAPKDNTRFDSKMIDQIRRKAIAPLSRLRDDLQPDSDRQLITAGNFTRAVWDFLKGLKVPEKLARQNKDDPADRQSGHRQLYDMLVNLFDELDEIFGAELLSVQDWTDILSSALAKMTLKLIPPALDEVLVGSIERSRHPDLKAVFLAGATQKQFPEPVSFDSLLTDDDRRAAEAGGFVLAAPAVQKLANRQYLAYIAFTRPSQYLCITYPLIADSGTPVLPSPFLDNLKSLFVDLADRPAEETTNVEDVRSEVRLTDLLCAKLGKDSNLPRDQANTLYALVEGLNEDEKLSHISRQVKYALSYENKAVLDKDFAKKFFGDSLECSATRLGSFAACPYKHFARYVLNLQRREQFTLEPLDLGRFYHRVLDGVFKRLKKESKDFATASDERLKSACTEVITDTVETDTFLANFKKRSLHNAYILDSAADILTQAVKAYAQMSRAGSFRQIASEFQFGSSDKNHIRCHLTISDRLNIFLKGIIDRIDSAEINGSQVAIIFDYKRKSQGFSWSRFYHALDMQLAIYMLALAGSRIAGQKIESIAGAFYLPIEAELSKQPEKFTRKAKGIFNGRFANNLDSETEFGQSTFYNFRILKKQQSPYGDYSRSGAIEPAEFEGLLKFARQKIIQTAEQLISGCIDITPYRLGKVSPCRYCDFRAVCKFDWQINEYRPLEQVSKEQVLKQAEGKSDS